MAKTKQERITSIEAEIQQLENQRKRLIQEQKEQERKDRTRRLCKRAGLLESLLPDTITLTDEHFKTFLEKAVLNDYAHKILRELTAQTVNTAAAKPADTVQHSGADTDEDEGNGEAVTA